MTPIDILIYFLVGIIILGIIYYAAGAMKIPEIWRNVIMLLAVLVILWMASRSGLF